MPRASVDQELLDQVTQAVEESARMQGIRLRAQLKREVIEKLYSLAVRDHRKPSRRATDRMVWFAK